MDLEKSTVLILGGSGLVGVAVARRVLDHAPRKLVLAALRRAEARDTVEELRRHPSAENVAIEPRWGDLFVPQAVEGWSRPDILADEDARRAFIDDLYGELTDDVFRRSALGALLLDIRPDVVVDAVNTAGALAYHDAFQSASTLRVRSASAGASLEAVEHHLSTLYLPQLIRHVQVALEGMKRVGTRSYVKIGTAGAGGMGLNIPFTHSEERPSRVLLAKAGLAGAHSLLLYLMARTPGAPAVKEIKPTAAISWKSVGYGPIRRSGRPVMRADAIRPVPLDEAFRSGAEECWEELDEPLEGVYLDAGENGLFSVSEFETLSALGLMEYVTPEEIAENVIREIRGHATGRDVVAALDASTMGPTYRAGVLRSHALARMDELERDVGVRGVAYEMLGPPRLSKLLFEGSILERLHPDLAAVAASDALETARRAEALVEEDADVRQRIVSIGLPILLPDGERVLRGPRVKVLPVEGKELTHPSVVDAGWIDLRPANWERWKDRVRQLLDDIDRRPSVEHGSGGDHEYGDESGAIRPGRLAAWVFRYEDKGERIKR